MRLLATPPIKVWWPRLQPNNIAIWMTSWRRAVATSHWSWCWMASGAILRTADAAGADGVVIPERRSAAVTAAVAKVSAGASEHLPIAKVTNISRALEELKEKDLWVVGLDERGEQTYDAIDYKMHCAIVLGAEGKGLHDLVRRHCDFLVSIPMLGKVPSLNVSVAAGVVLYEVVRQRRPGASKKS